MNNACWAILLAAAIDSSIAVCMALLSLLLPFDMSYESGAHMPNTTEAAAAKTVAAHFIEKIHGLSLFSREDLDDTLSSR